MVMIVTAMRWRGWGNMDDDDDFDDKKLGMPSLAEPASCKNHADAAVEGG